jgi:N-acetylglucosamine-6-phosphate deacetylase
MKAIVGGTIYTPEEVFEKGIIVLDGKRISSVGKTNSSISLRNMDIIEVSAKMIVPGFIDVHIHGLLGYDSMGAGLCEVIKRLPQYGVTSFMATTITLTDKETIRQLQIMKQIIEEPPIGARCLGIHLEGPFLSIKRPGMSTIEWMRPLNFEDFSSFQKAAGGLIKMVTFAPEDGKAMSVIPVLIANGVIPIIGHSEANYEEAAQSIRLGVNHATHTFNAMSPLRHREPGVAGAVLVHDEVYAELIADGVHVHPAVMDVLLRAKGLDRTVLVSDAAPLAGVPDGEYEWEHKPILVKNQVCQLENGTIAGAHKLLDTGVRNLVNLLGMPLQEALVPATRTAAASLGIDDKKGNILAGYDADLTVLDENLNPWMTIVDGEIVWQRESGEL